MAFIPDGNNSCGLIPLQNHALNVGGILHQQVNSVLVEISLEVVINSLKFPELLHLILWVGIVIHFQPGLL